MNPPPSPTPPPETTVPTLSSETTAPTPPSETTAPTLPLETAAPAPPSETTTFESAYVTYHNYYEGQSLLEVSCSDGENGLMTRWGYDTIDPMAPFVAGE